MVATTSSSSMSSVPVLISGAGPVGLFEAYLLTQQGIQVRIIERERAICPLSKAMALHSRSLEILQFTGLSDEFLRRGFPMTDFKMLIGNQHMTTVSQLAGADTHYSFALFLEQHRTSEILVEELAKRGVSVDYGWELVDTKVVEAGEDGQEPYVETIIRRALSGDNTCADEKAFIGRVDQMQEQEGKAYETQTVRSQYLVAADGGRSTVRHKLNIPFPGRLIPQKSFMWDGTFESDCDLSGISFISGTNHKTMLVFPLTNGDVRVVVEELDSDEKEDVATTLKDLTTEKFEKMASAAIAPSTFKIKTTSWLTCFKVNERRAENFIHKKRIFLIGDAAHIHSPAGGQGLNTGLHDAHNLAWKLALVLNKVAPESLLESYEGERQAMADRSIALSAKLLRVNRANGYVVQIIKRLYYTFAPYLMMAMKALNIEPEAAMLNVRYSENSINQRHATQQPPRSEYQVGVRAKDGPLCTLGFDSNSNEPSQLRVHDLMLGISRFHILVFVSDGLKFATHAGASNQGAHTVSYKELAHNIDRFLSQWRRKWAYGSNLNDGYKDKDLFKVHIIAGSFIPGSQSSLDVMFKRNAGEGRLYLNLNGSELTDVGPLDSGENHQRWPEFPQLKTLRLYLEFPGITTLHQTQWVRKCPQLRHFSWNIDEDNDGHRRLPARELSKLFSQDCPLLEELDLEHPKLTDEDLNRILLAGRRIKMFHVCRSKFGPLAFESLGQHFATLTTLDLRRCFAVTSPMNQRIMTSCPNLQWFCSGRLDARDILGVNEGQQYESPPEEGRHHPSLGLGEQAPKGRDEQPQPQDWACSELRFLTLYLCGLENRPAAWQDQVLRQLSRLTQLDFLTLGVDDWTLDGTRDGIQLSLDAGLNQLRSLTKLDRFCFDGVAQDMTEKDVCWMLEAWPKLERVEGRLHTDNGQRRELEKILLARDVQMCIYSDDDPEEDEQDDVAERGEEHDVEGEGDEDDDEDDEEDDEDEEAVEQGSGNLHTRDC